MKSTLLLFFVFLIGLTSCNAKGTDNLISGNTPGNIKNDGIVATDGEWEYFWTGTTRFWDTNGGKLCKMKPDGSNFQILSNDNPCYINVAGDYIYYIKQPEPTNYIGNIYRINKNGKDKKELYNGKCSAMTVVGDWIYFINLSDGNKIFKIKTDGSKLTKLIDTKSYALQYEDGWFYYLIGTPPKNFVLHKFDILDLHQEKVLDKIDNFNISDGWIYGSNSYNDIYKIKNDGTGYVNLFKQKISSFNVWKDFIYCSGADADYFVKGKGRSCYIYKISLDGKQSVTLPNADVISRDSVVGVTDNYVYYWVNRGEWLELARMKNDGTGDEILINRLKTNKTQ